MLKVSNRSSIECEDVTQDEGSTVVILDSVEPEECVKSLVVSPMSAVLQAENPFFFEDFRYLRELNQHFEKPAEANEIPLPWDRGSTPLVSLSIAKEGRPTQILDSFGEKLESSISSDFAQDMIRTLAGEFVMNAVYDAAREGEQNREFQPGQLAAYMGADCVFISCVDYYGSLDSRKYFARLAEVYEKGIAKTIRREGPGAGIGCHMILENCSTLIQIVEKGVQTVAIGRVPLKNSYKSFLSCPKNIIILNQGGGDG